MERSGSPIPAWNGDPGLITVVRTSAWVTHARATLKGRRGGRRWSECKSLTGTCPGRAPCFPLGHPAFSPTYLF